MAWTRTYDDAEPQRVNRWLAQSGVCSRREAEALIAEGLVTIDGEVVADPGRKIIPGQTLILADKAARIRAWRPASDPGCLHKPVGIVSSQPEAGQIPAVRLITQDTLWGSKPDHPLLAKAAWHPVGRLDMDSRGLLDPVRGRRGGLQAVIGPESELEKEYLVRFNGELTRDKLALLRHGLELDGRQLRPATVTQNDDRQLRIILKEGRNRQIRRMFSLINLAVTDLLRIRVGPIHLDALPEGKWRPLSPEGTSGS